jgi:hypothetical protein
MIISRIVGPLKEMTILFRKGILKGHIWKL